MHTINRSRHAPYGFWGQPGHDDLPMPSEDTDLLIQFRSDFRLSRGSKPGLSIVIPHPDTEITTTGLIGAVARQYIHPLLAKILTVDVESPAGSWRLNDESLATFLTAEFVKSPDELKRLMDLIRWALEHGASRRVILGTPGEASAPKWTSDLVGEEATAAIQVALRSNQRVSIRASVPVTESGKTPAIAGFDVILERDDEASARPPVFIREGIAVSNVRAQVDRTIRAVVVVDEGPLAKLLGDAENPAHTEWQERSPKLKERYEYGASCVRFVRNSVREIIRAVTQADEAIDTHLLDDLFSLPAPADPSPRVPRPGLKPGPERKDLPELEAPRPRLFRLEKLKDGFVVHGAGDDAMYPALIEISAAYEVRRGNPFSRYQDADFYLDRPPIQLCGRQPP